MAIEDAIYTKLVGTSAITSLVGSRIYHRWFKATDIKPLVTIMRVSSVPLGSSGCNHPTERVVIQIDAWSSRPSEARTIADLIKATLRGWESTSPVSGPWKCMSDTDAHESPKDGSSYGIGRVTLTFSAHYTA